MKETIGVLYKDEWEKTALAKQLFLWDKKKKENMFLVCADVDANIDLKALGKYLNCGKDCLRGGDHDTLYKFLGCKQGMCNYFAMINDTGKAVKILID